MKNLQQISPQNITSRAQNTKKKHIDKEDALVNVHKQGMIKK